MRDSSVVSCPRLLVLGWDAADWQVIDPLLAAGKMPNLARLIAAGSRADLRTLEPKLSPLLWTTIATGKTADVHGILNFVEPSPSGDGVRVSASTSRRVRALWNILTLAGRRVHAVGWYASHPAEPIRGACASNLLSEGAPTAPGQRWGEVPGAIRAEGCGELADRMLAARVAPADITRDALRELLPEVARAARGDARPVVLAKEMARMLTVHRVAMEAVRGAEWDCAMVFHDTIDTIGHHFMEHRPPRLPHVPAADLRIYGEVMDRTYRMHDRLLGELLDACGPGTAVLLVSDHGFRSGADRPVIVDVSREERAALESRWHRELGVLVTSGPGFRQGAACGVPSLLDVAPTVLAACGLAVGRDMHGRALVELLDGAVVPAAVDSWDQVAGEAGEHPPETRQDPFEAVDALRQLVDLGYMPDMGDDHARMIDLARRESRFNEAVVRMTTGRPGTAVPLLKQLVDAHPAELRYASTLAQCLMADRQHVDGLEAIERWAALAPDAVEPAMLRVAALHGLGRGAEAVAALDAVEPAAVGASGGRAALASLYGLLCAWDRSLAHARAAIVANPALQEPHLLAARAALELGDWDSAGEHAMDAAERRMSHPESHYLLGAALAWGGELEHSAQSLDVALTLDPRYGEAIEFAIAVAESAGHRPRVDALTAARSDAILRHAGIASIRDAAHWRKGRPT